MGLPLHITVVVFLYDALVFEHMYVRFGFRRVIATSVTLKKCHGGELYLIMDVAIWGKKPEPTTGIANPLTTWPLTLLHL